MPASNWSLITDYALLIVIGITGALGDVWIYYWVKSRAWLWFLAASLIWIISLYSFAVLVARENRSFAAAFMLATVLHIGAVVVYDQIWLSERLTALEWLGMALGTTAVIVLEFGHKPEVSTEPLDQRDVSSLASPGDERP